MHPLPWSADSRGSDSSGTASKQPLTTHREEHHLSEPGLGLSLPPVHSTSGTSVPVDQPPEAVESERRRQRSE